MRFASAPSTESGLIAFGYWFICCRDGGRLTFSVLGWDDPCGYARQLRIGGRLLSRVLRRAKYFLDFCRLREALTDLVMISPSVLPKAFISIGAGSKLFTSERADSSWRVSGERVAWGVC